MSPDQRNNQETAQKGWSAGGTRRCNAVKIHNTVANCAGQGVRRAALKATWVSTAARWAGPALMAALVLAVARPSGPEKASAGFGDVGPNDEAPKQDSCDGQLSRADRLDPQSETRATSADYGSADESADTDPEVRAYLDYVRSDKCNLTDHEKLLDTKSVKGASRDDLHSAGYTYSEIEASFKRFSAFLVG